MILQNVYFRSSFLNPNVKTHPESQCDMWAAFAEEVVLLAIEASICWAFVYSVIRGLSTLPDYTVVLGDAHQHTTLFSSFHLQPHGHSSHRRERGGRVHRKLGVWQDKTQHSSDIVSRQPVSDTKKHTHTKNHLLNDMETHHTWLYLQDNSRVLRLLCHNLYT